ncbi:hypothetical protein AUJ69_03825 [Candidatus Woesearchaeota archaeon CG1_02_47_18]|nr:MAG: hypothetical protein AUJ69_03825 [Candidatus Woesearchaeota archaeon CG1_02_47_18]
MGVDKKVVGTEESVGEVILPCPKQKKDVTEDDCTRCSLKDICEAYIGRGSKLYEPGESQ